MSNETQAGKSVRIAVALGLVLGVLLAGASAAQDGVCEGFEKSHTIGALGGANAFSTKGADSLGALQDLFVAHRGELERVMAERGVEHLTDEVFQAIASGKGVVERDLRNGETFEWMALRRNGLPSSAGPMCVKSRKTWGAWEITVSTARTVSSTPPTCALTVTGDCAAGTLNVSSAGSSAGVEVMMSGPEGGSKSVISGSSTSWEGSFDNRYKSNYTFTAVGEMAAGQEVTTYTFVIPKACLNLALVQEEKSSAKGEMLACEKKVTIDACAAGAANCQLSLAATRSRTGQDVVATMSGHYPGGLEGRILDGKGNEVEPLAFTDGTASVSMNKVGRYTVQATATNEVGETASCEEDLLVGPRWAVRGYGGPLWTSDDEFTDTTPGVDGGPLSQSSAEIRSKAVFENGTLFGLGAEYYFNERWGVEADVQFGSVDARFQADIGDLWDMDEDNVGMTILSIGPNFHLTPNKLFDLYLGAYVAFVSFDDPEWTIFGDTLDVDLKNQESFGLQLGADFPLGNSPWAINGALRFLPGLSAEDKNDSDAKVDLDPTILTGGISYRF